MRASTVFALIAVASIAMFTALGVTLLRCDAAMQIERMHLLQTAPVAPRVFFIPSQEEGESEAERPSVWRDSKTAQN